MSEPGSALILDYLTEAREGLEAAERDLLALEAEREHFNEERIDRICRSLNSFKAGSLLCGAGTISMLAQKAENAMANIRFQGIVPTQARVTVLLHAIDVLNEMILRPDINNDEEIAGLVAQLAMPNATLATVVEKANVDQARQARGANGRLQILIVEDDLTCRLLLQTFLSRYGECHVALSGKEAVEAFRIAQARHSGYDLVCMDIMMPEMDGREAVHHIRVLEERRGVRPPHGVTIFMTTTVREIRDVFRCFNELCDAYLLKPIDLGQLLARMKFFELIQ